jgi:hypothetical protein
MGFPNEFFNDSWVVGIWRAGHGGNNVGLEALLRAKSGKRVSPPFKPILLRIACDGLLTIQPEIRQSLAVTCGSVCDDRRRAAAIPYNVRTAAESHDSPKLSY